MTILSLFLNCIFSLDVNKTFVKEQMAGLHHEFFQELNISQYYLYVKSIRSAFYFWMKFEADILKKFSMKNTILSWEHISFLKEFLVICK